MKSTPIKYRIIFFTTLIAYMCPQAQGATSVTPGEKPVYPPSTVTWQPGCRTGTLDRTSDNCRQAAPPGQTAALCDVAADTYKIPNPNSGQDNNGGYIQSTISCGWRSTPSNGGVIQYLVCGELFAAACVKGGL